jgi:hypothetical protein
MTVAKALASQTTKLLPANPQDTTVSVLGSSTTSKVLVRNGGGPSSARPSIGRGSPGPPAASDHDDDNCADAPREKSTKSQSNSSFTMPW